MARRTCRQRGIPLALAQQLDVGYAAPGAGPHPARDWRGGRVVFPHTTPDGRLVNLYGRAVGTAEQVPKAKRHDHLPGAKGYFNATALLGDAGPLWVCEGAFDMLSLLAAGVPRVVAIFGVQGWRWDWAREVRALVFALDADPAGQQQWRQLGRQEALRGKQVAVLSAAAYGGYKDVSAAWAAGVLAVGVGSAAAAAGGEVLTVPQHLQEPWAERVAIMITDGGLTREEAERPCQGKERGAEKHTCSSPMCDGTSVHASVCFCGKGREHGLYSPRSRTRVSATTPRSWSRSRDGASPAMRRSSRRAGNARRCERHTPVDVAIAPGHHHVHS